MNQRRIFIAIIVAFVLISGGLVGYLATSHTEDPKEIETARQLLTIMEAPAETPVGTPKESGGADVRNARDVMRAIRTLTATPSPSPAPTATPVPLSVMIHTWTVVDIDDKYVVVIDSRNNEEIRLELNGPGKSVENQGATMTVKLVKVNMEADSPEATLCAEGDNCAAKAMP